MSSLVTCIHLHLLEHGRNAQTLQHFETPQNEVVTLATCMEACCTDALRFDTYTVIRFVAPLQVSGSARLRAHIG